MNSEVLFSGTAISRQEVYVVEKRGFLVTPSPDPTSHHIHIVGAELGLSAITFIKRGGAPAYIENPEDLLYRRVRIESRPVSAKKLFGSATYFGRIRPSRAVLNFLAMFATVSISLGLIALIFSLGNPIVAGLGAILLFGAFLLPFATLSRFAYLSLKTYGLHDVTPWNWVYSIVSLGGLSVRILALAAGTLLGLVTLATNTLADWYYLAVIGLFVVFRMASIIGGLLKRLFILIGNL